MQLVEMGLHTLSEAQIQWLAPSQRARNPEMRAEGGGWRDAAPSTPQSWGRGRKDHPGAEPPDVRPPDCGGHACVCTPKVW